MTLAIIAGAGWGAALACLVGYLLAVKPLILRLSNLRYDGFRGDLPIPREPRPKTVPLPREDH